MPELRNPFVEIAVLGFTQGEIMRPSADYDNELPTKNQWLEHPTYSEALGVLAKRREELGDKSPCEANPSLWDGIDFEDGEKSLAYEAMRVSDAIAQCSYCPVLDACEGVLLATLDTPNSPASGVIAGVWVDGTVQGGYVDHYLTTGEWPDRVNPLIE